MKNPLFRSLIVGLIFACVYYAVQMIRGMYLTKNYVPDIAGRYTMVDYLQHKITFVHEYSPLGRVIEFSGLMLLGIMVYFTWRFLRIVTTKK